MKKSDKDNVDNVVEFLNNYFYYNSPLFFKRQEGAVLPTIEIELKENKFLMPAIFAFTDKFKPELLDVLKKYCNVENIEFNNTSRIFWW